MKSARVIILLSAVALFLSGCGLRFETAPVIPAPPSEAEVARQQAAIALTAIAQADNQVLGVTAPSAKFAQERATLLGGIWQACPADTSEKLCRDLPDAPVVPKITTAAQAQGQLKAALAALMKLAETDTSSGVLATGILPSMMAELDPELIPALPAWGEPNWVVSEYVAKPLDWSAWQLEALAARTQDPQVAALAVHFHQAIKNSTASSWREQNVYQTEDLKLAEILQRAGVEIAANTANISPSQRPAVMSFLLASGRLIRESGGTQPMSWVR